MIWEITKTAHAKNLSHSDTPCNQYLCLDRSVDHLDSEDLDLNSALLLTGCVTLGKIISHV